MEQTDNFKRGGGRWGLVESEGISQKTYMHDLWTRTTVQGLTVGGGLGWVEWVIRGKVR